MLPLLIAGALRSGKGGGFNPFSGIGKLWQDVSGVTASNTAADAQLTGITNAQNALQESLGGYAGAGQDALNAQLALTGALGPDAQREAVAALESSPMFQSLAAQGEQAILQNASATGGLRGGNTQGALAQFRPQLLNQTIQERFANLGGISNLGLAASQQLGSGLSGLAQSAGNVGASNALGNYNLQRGLVSDVAGFGVQLAKAFGTGGLSLLGDAGSLLGGGGGGGFTKSKALNPLSGITGGGGTSAYSQF